MFKKVQNLGLRIRAGYETNNEPVQVHHCICHRAWHHILDSRTLIVIYGHRIDQIEPTATAASLMIGRGFEPRTEQMLNAGDRLQLLNMEQQEPIFLLQTRTHSV